MVLPCREKGWLAVEHDLKHSINIDNANYTSLCMQRMAMPTFKALQLATECTSFSRANTGKGAVRNNEYICGFPWNCDRKREKAELGNRLLAISMQLVMFCLARSIAFTLGNPATSMMWMHPLVRALFLEAVGPPPNKTIWCEHATAVGAGRFENGHTSLQMWQHSQL